MRRTTILLAASLVALGAGVAAAIVAILQLKDALG
jgi:hypothetical protein